MGDAPPSSSPPQPFDMAAMSNGEDLACLQGLSLNSSPVKPSSSAHTTRASSSEPSSTSGTNLPMFVQQEDIEDMDDDDDDEGGTRKGKKGSVNPGRRKIEIEYIDDKSKRHITFSKRKAGIMKKAYELSTLTGTQVLLLVVSETGLVYTYTTNKLQPLVTAKEGKALIQACLTAEEGEPPFGDKADMLENTATRTRADHRKVSMQVRLDPNPNSNMTFTPSRPEPPLPSPSYPLQPMQQLQSQPPQPHLMQLPYHPSQQLQQQHIQPSLMSSTPMTFQQPPTNMIPMGIPSMPSMPPPVPGENAVNGTRTLKKRKTVDNLRQGKESAEQTEMRRNEATQMAHDLLDAAHQSPTIGNLLRAYQQQDVATRSKPPKTFSESNIVEGLDSTIQLFYMSCEDSSNGPEADQARLRGERWIDHVGMPHIAVAIDYFLHDFLVNKVIRTAKDVKAAAKDIQNFADWLFAHSFISGGLHSQLAKLCGSSGKVNAMKKKGSEPDLAIPSLSMSSIQLMPNGLVRPSNPAARAETAGKTLIEYCEFARGHYDGLGQEQGVTALNGYFVVDRVRQTYCILRGIPIEGDPHSNSEPGPFKVRMPRQLTVDLRARDQFLLSLNRYVHLNYWIPTACGDVHPTNDEELGEDPLNPQFHHMEADKAHRVNDQLSFNYHVTEFQYSSKVVQYLDEGDLPEDGFGGVSVQQVLHTHPSQQSIVAHNAQARPVRRQPTRAKSQADLNNGWDGLTDF